MPAAENSQNGEHVEELGSYSGTAEVEDFLIDTLFTAPNTQNKGKKQRQREEAEAKNGKLILRGTLRCT